MFDRRDFTRLAAAAFAGIPFLRSPAYAEDGPDGAVPPPQTGHEDEMAGYDPKVRWMGDERIAMLMYPGMTVMDLIGPQSMFAAMMGAKIHLVAKSLDPVTSDAGVTITPDATFETCPRDLTVLFAPGGTDGTINAATDPATIAFMADRGSRATYVTSVCSGSLVLGAAGLLKGYRATSHWSCRDALAGFGAIPTEARVVRDRNRITGAGVTAGLDFGLTMVAEMRGRTYAECCQLMSEYDPDPPFKAGSLKTAPPEVREPMVKMVASFKQAAEALAANSGPR
ncbi:DJ-1/PfpI family protein [Methylobacterium sp. WCS2018Hpa-22]|uniref:DJ-1/PfpI family protein n=1 Tax=Methylobacterium sp. WCS2018Hpa-22 TaxID=3073633 RepID=UPI0028899CC9|nr:DJ-1/PfpI family protein [Methylobacterium sp. WCS2018Hpa-22]